MLRKDGFVSLRAGYPGGEWTSKPLIFSGTELILNYSTSANGSIRVEIQDAATGQPIPGFVLDDSPVIFGDKIAGSVNAWIAGEVKSHGGSACRSLILAAPGDGAEALARQLKLPGVCGFKVYHS